MVDLLGLGIFLIGILLVVAELAQPGYYVGVAGTVGIIVGLLQMAWPDFLTSAWSPFVVTVVAVVASFASIQFYKRFAPPAAAPETFASDKLVGQRGPVLVDVKPNDTSGKVKIGGIVWSAESESDPLPKGAEALVVRVEGVHLVVRSAPPMSPSSPP